jgi:hypothetical protein
MSKPWGEAHKLIFALSQTLVYLHASTQKYELNKLHRTPRIEIEGYQGLVNQAQF